MSVSREKKLLIGFALVVGIPVALIWAMGWSVLRPWNLPHVTSGQLDTPYQRVLSAVEVQTLDHWLQAHRSGWGAEGEVPPHAGDVVFRLETAKGGVLWVSIWRHNNTPEDDDVGIQTQEHGPYRMNSVAGDAVKGLIPSDVPPPSDGVRLPE